MHATTRQAHADHLTLIPVGADHWRDVAALKVTDAQRAFVAEPAYYLMLCAYDGVWKPLAVCLGQRVIGFLMWAVDPEDDSCWLGGFCIDARYQRQGYGRRALETAMNMLAAEHGRHRFALTYHPENPSKGLYRSLGFRETGEMDDDEVVARRS